MPAEPSVAHFRVSLALDARPTSGTAAHFPCEPLQTHLANRRCDRVIRRSDVLPVGYRVSPKRDLSAFDNFADIWAFFEFGLILIGIGLIAFLLPFFLPGDDEYWK
jgi:hypothetical protein